MKRKILVMGDTSYGDPLKVFGDIEYGYYSINTKISSNVGLIMFTGGEDVHPTFYGGKVCGLSYTNYERDIYEKNIFEFAVSNGIKCTGICRGFQFLNVMCGGKMYQDIRNHAGKEHCIKINNIDEKPSVISTHHQLVKLKDSANAVAVAAPSLSTVYIGPDGIMTYPPKYEVEAATFPKYNSFGVQFHPEMMEKTSFGYKTYIHMMDCFLNDAMYF